MFKASNIKLSLLAIGNQIEIEHEAKKVFVQVSYNVADNTIEMSLHWKLCMKKNQSLRIQQKIINCLGRLGNIHGLPVNSKKNK